jgi:hypothetical protein
MKTVLVILFCIFGLCVAVNMMKEPEKKDVPLAKSLGKETKKVASDFYDGWKGSDSKKHK